MEVESISRQKLIKYILLNYNTLVMYFINCKYKLHICPNESTIQYGFIIKSYSYPGMIDFHH